MLPDVQFGARWYDEDPTAEDRTLWAEKEAAFFARPRSTAKGKAKARGRKGVVKKRVSAHASGRALDRLLQTVLGKGLGDFVAKPADKDLELGARPLLVVFMDEGSPTYALSWYLTYQQQLRCMFISDVFHMGMERHHNRTAPVQLVGHSSTCAACLQFEPRALGGCGVVR